MKNGIVGQGFEMSNEGLKVIQGVFELRKPASEIVQHMLENSEWIIAEEEKKSLTEILEEEFHQEGRHLALTAAYLNKEGIE